MPNGSILNLLLSLVLAVVIAPITDRRPFEEVAKRTAIAEETSKPDTKCPLSRKHVDKADLDLLSVCLKYGLGAYSAAQRYPNTATKVFGVYGDEEKFQNILNQYGHEVVPVIAYFVDNGSVEIEIRYTLRDMLEQMWAGEKPALNLKKLTPDQIGLVAIYQIAAQGHEMLAEFEIVDGNARRRPLTTIILEGKHLLVGGIMDVEKVLARGERLPTWEEASLAILDGTIVFGGVGAFAKATRAGGLFEKSTAKLLLESAYKTTRTVGKTGMRIAPIALLYLAVTRPALIPALGGWIAEQFGIDRTIGVVAVYFIEAFLVLELLWPVIW
jgi:hypothetical protein